VILGEYPVKVVAAEVQVNQVTKSTDLRRQRSSEMVIREQVSV